jgi:preprotein translocase subunit SecE
VAVQIYKSGQGRYVRIGTAIGVALVALVLAYYVWGLLAQYVSDAIAYKVYLEYAIPAVVFAVLMAGVGYYMLQPKAADFLIATESEMKKVSWSSKAELIGSTVVVIVTVVLLAAFIFLVDILISGGLSQGWTIPFTTVQIPGLGLW